MQLGAFEFTPVPILYIVSVGILLYWCREFETKKYVLFLYFILGTWFSPLLSTYTENTKFELWFPFGFTFATVYLMQNKHHPLKWKATFLGLIVGGFALVYNYLPN